MRVKESESKFSYQYSGDLEKELKKSQAELNRINCDLPMYKKIYLKAKKELESKEKRKEHLERFIILAKKELDK